jgi:phospho-N-acetylmuramoyl-pentapeptide-transferase
MGGLIILACAIVPTLLWSRFDNQRYVILALLVTVWMGGIGFLDDYLKLRQKREGKKNEGLVERYKLAGQVGIGLILGLVLWLYPVSNLPGPSTTLPFVKFVLLMPLTAGLAWLYVPWVTFIITGVSNSVNITDGLDGLAAGLCAIIRGRCSWSIRAKAWACATAIRAMCRPPPAAWSRSRGNWPAAR